MHEVTVCKFGGSSLADAGRFRRVRDIIRADERRKYIIVSAPGKSTGDDIKITDMLIAAYEQPDMRGQILDKVRRKFRAIAAELGIPAPELDSLEEYAKTSRDAIASRGEHICARLMAEYLQLPCIEAADIFRFHGGALDTDATYENIRRIGSWGVIAGFYGADESGNIVTFPRGGSDISAAHIAAALGAAQYENWTDVDGFFTADPAIIANARHIPRINYRQAQLYSYLGAGVLHHDSISPAADANIPIIVRSTFAPNRQGTLISKNACCDMPCIASRKLANGMYLISAMNLTAAMTERAKLIIGGGIDHCGMVCTECCPDLHAPLMRKLHAALSEMYTQN
ncbi:MAG: hypothetical protein IJC56_08635 [Clostridia bacterium]|nr:hypothetical protein [Clostridia bacterium]